MQCTAKAKSTGKQCARAAIAGANVCRVHGGAAPQVKAKAQQRLDEAKAVMLDNLPQIASELTRIALSGDNEGVRVQATREVFARLGFGEPDKLEVSQVPSAEMVASWIEALEADLASKP